MARYSLIQRAKAKSLGLPLVTVDVLGFTFTGPMEQDEAQALLSYITVYFERRRVRLKGPPWVTTPEPVALNQETVNDTQGMVDHHTDQSNRSDR